MADIILAEDDTSMREFITLALENAGHTVHAESDGLGALVALESGTHFDLLLTDIVMPGMDGIELADKAKKLYPDLRIMFITGFTAIAMENHQPGINKQNILSKPFHLNDLVKQVSNLLDEG